MQRLRTAIPTFTVRAVRAVTCCGRASAALATSLTVLGFLGACTAGAPTQDAADAPRTTEVGRSAPSDATQAVRYPEREALRVALERTMSSTVRVKMTSTLRQGSQTYVIGMEGVYDMPRRAGQIRVVMPGGALERVDVVYTAKTVYVKGLPELPQGAWLGLSRDRAWAHYLLRTPANDPRDVLRWCSRLQGVIGPRTESGQPRKPPGRYRGFLEFESILQYLAPGRRAKAAQWGYRANINWVPAVVDVTSDGLVSSVDMRLDIPPADVSMALRMTLFEHAQPVHVKEPDPRSVVPGRAAGGVLLG